MPGPYLVALVKPIARDWPQNPDEFTRQYVVLVSENYQESPENALYRSWIVTGGSYPFWFLEHEKVWESLNDGAYAPAPPAFLAQNPQRLYIRQNYRGFGQFAVYTPGLDPPGLYFVFESKKHGRDQVLYCSGQDLEFKCTQQWSREISAIHARQNAAAALEQSVYKH